VQIEKYEHDFQLLPSCLFPSRRLRLFWEVFLVSPRLPHQPEVASGTWVSIHNGISDHRPHVHSLLLPCPNCISPSGCPLSSPQQAVGYSAGVFIKSVFADPIFSEAEVAAERELRERVRKDPDMRVISYAQALQEAMREEMRRDERVFLMGEDIGLYGGAYGATRGLVQEFGEWRVLDTPISEASIGGAAVGAAMAGMRPVTEIMYVDFTPLAMDQIANQGAKNRYMFGGKTKVPMVVRTEGGAGRAIAAHHSQSLESLWTHFPGIYVVMPSTPYDAKGLLKAAIRDDNPVMFIEHKMLYKEKGPIPEEEYIIPFGIADVNVQVKISLL
jgi:2-oxoisovalerate dehydrogenase E1 component